MDLDVWITTPVNKSDKDYDGSRSFGERECPTPFVVGTSSPTLYGHGLILYYVSVPVFFNPVNVSGPLPFVIVTV